MTAEPEPQFTLLFHDDVLLDRRALADELPAATALVMVARFGGEAKEWAGAYNQILEDWGSYWDDLNIDAEDSVDQWREGRWRVARALFRLIGKPAPDDKDMRLHLDTIPRETGRNCATWRPGAAEGLRGLAERGVRLGILTPSLPAELVWGMAGGARLDGIIGVVLGPDELEQVGLDGLAWEWIERLAKAEPGYCLLVYSSRQPPIKAPTLLPTSDLSRLPVLISRFGGL